MSPVPDRIRTDEDQGFLGDHGMGLVRDIIGF